MMEEIDDVGFEESMIVCGTRIKFSNLWKQLRDVNGMARISQRDGDDGSWEWRRTDCRTFVYLFPGFLL